MVAPWPLLHMSTSRTDLFPGPSLLKRIELNPHQMVITPSLYFVTVITGKLFKSPFVGFMRTDQEVLQT